MHPEKAKHVLMDNDSNAVEKKEQKDPCKDNMLDTGDVNDSISKTLSGLLWRHAKCLFF